MVSSAGIPCLVFTVGRRRTRKAPASTAAALSLCPARPYRHSLRPVMLMQVSGQPVNVSANSNLHWYMNLSPVVRFDGFSAVLCHGAGNRRKLQGHACNCSEGRPFNRLTVWPDVGHVGRKVTGDSFGRAVKRYKGRSCLTMTTIQQHSKASWPRSFSATPRAQRHPAIWQDGAEVDSTCTHKFSALCISCLLLSRG
jgi:hypothetical protein